MMQKLAQLSMVQRGANVMPAAKLDPKTGAPLVNTDDSRLIYNQMSTGRSSGAEPIRAGAAAGGKPSTTSSGTGPDPSSHASSQTQGMLILV